MKRLAVAGLLVGAMGCYTLQPVANQPLPLGSYLSIGINDAGRVALGGSMGPEIASLEGRLVRKDSTEYVLAVSQINLMRGGQQVWAGEHARVRTDYVTSVSERKLSRSRTAVVSAVTLGIVVYVFRQGLNGLLLGDEGKPVPSDTGTTTRIPRFGR